MSNVTGQCRLLGMCLAAGLMAGSIAAQTDVADAGNLRVTRSEQSGQGMTTAVSIDADDAFLPSILTMLSEISGYNIVTAPEVNRHQQISIHLKDTPIEEAINLVVRAAGLSYEVVGNSFLVGPQEDLQKEVGITSHLIELQYAKAAEVKEFLKDLTTGIQVDTSHNALLVTTSPKAMNEIRSIVRRIDVPAKQIVLRTRVIEVAVNKVKEIGIDWEKLSKLTTIVAERPFDPAIGGRSPTADELGDPGLGELPNKHVFQEIDGLKNIGYFDRQLTAFDITLDFLLRNDCAKLLTDTKLATLNNRKAYIHIGEVIPIIVRSTESASIERERIGIKVAITPQVNDEGYITATVNPEQSTIVGFINGELPRTKIRTANTTVLVRDRQKIIIAGLMSTKSNVEVFEVPFFGKIPYFGKLFKHWNESNETMDLIIEITPYIISADSPMAQMMQDSLFESIADPIQRYEARLADSTYGDFDSLAPAPTHLASMPTTSVLKPGQFVVGVNELSVGVGDGIQFRYSPWYAVGKLMYGAKVQLNDRTALGIGYHDGRYYEESKYNLGSRLGVFGVTAPIHTSFFQWLVSIDGQFGDYRSYGVSTGLALHAGSIISLMLEAGNSYTKESPDEREYWDPWATAAFRLRAPWHKNFSIDAGISMQADEWFVDPVSRHYEDYTPRLYFDLSYTGIIKERLK